MGKEGRKEGRWVGGGREGHCKGGEEKEKAGILTFDFV